MTDTVNDYLTREMNRSLGSAMAENAGKGILNSSVTSKAIGEIGSNTADAFAKNYGQMLGQTSQNYGTLMGGAQDAQSGVYDDLNNKYASPSVSHSTLANGLRTVVEVLKGQDESEKKCNKVL